MNETSFPKTTDQARIPEYQKELTEKSKHSIERRVDGPSIVIASTRGGFLSVSVIPIVDSGKLIGQRFQEIV